MEQDYNEHVFAFCTVHAAVSKRAAVVRINSEPCCALEKKDR